MCDIAHAVCTYMNAYRLVSTQHIATNPVSRRQRIDVADDEHCWDQIGGMRCRHTHRPLRRELFKDSLHRWVFRSDGLNSLDNVGSVQLVNLLLPGTCGSLTPAERRAAIIAARERACISAANNTSE
eukprot:COSAG02_NODE_4623_length_5153_cov_3.148793_2_plen_127_part_00